MDLLQSRLLFVELVALSVKFLLALLQALYFRFDALPFQSRSNYALIVEVVVVGPFVFHASRWLERRQESSMIAMVGRFTGLILDPAGAEDWLARPLRYLDRVATELAILHS